MFYRFNLSNYAIFSILAENSDQRGRIYGRLKDNGIPAAIYYEKPIYQQRAYEGFEVAHCPVAEEVCRRIFSIFCHPYLKRSDQDKIIKIIKEEA